MPARRDHTLKCGHCLSGRHEVCNGYLCTTAAVPCKCKICYPTGDKWLARVKEISLRKARP